jgi:hypothetical protein
VSVVLADTATERLHSTAEAFTARDARVLPVIIDVSDAGAVTALASRTLEHFGRVDVVVNNAGIITGSAGPLWQADPQDWQRVLAVNLLGVVHGIRAFVPHLVACPALVRTPMTEGMFTLAQADDDVLTEHLPPHLSRQQLRASLQRMIANPMEPDVAAERILAAVETDRLYALTHGDFDGSVRQRAEGILAALHNPAWSHNHVETASNE